MSAGIRSVQRIIFPTFFLLFWLSLIPPGYGQRLEDYLGDEYNLYKETKQVNQFFRRFNCEEKPDGTRLHQGDSLYHDAALRRSFLNMLFDKEEPMLTSSLRKKFVASVMDPECPQYLGFHGGDWFAEVKTTFLYQGEEEAVILFLKLEEAEVGSKWVFTNVYFAPFQQYFEDSGNAEVQPGFLHPLSHELDFMNLIKVFRNKENLEIYAEQEFQPDYLTLFLYELKKSNLEFVTVNRVRFHFFQIDGWYFELSDINRPGPNRGWLIHQLSEVAPGQKDLLLKYIYRE